MNYKTHFLLFIVNIISIFTIVLFLTPDQLFVQFINILFYFALLYTTVFLFHFVAKGGFFDGLIFGFRRFKNVMFHKNDVLEEWKEKPLPSENINLRLYEVLKIQTVALNIVLLLLLVIYYSL
jgi:hypothetical protein